MGGLGPNIGGAEWQVKREKLKKMQEFFSKIHQPNLRNTETLNFNGASGGQSEIKFI